MAANIITCGGRTGILTDSACIFNVPNHPGRFKGELYLKYQKGTGTKVSIKVEIYRNRLNMFPVQNPPAIDLSTIYNSWMDVKTCPSGFNDSGGILDCGNGIIVMTAYQSSTKTLDIWRSINRGLTWSKVASWSPIGFLSGEGRDSIVHCGNGVILIATLHYLVGTWQPGSLLRSADYGATWDRLDVQQGETSYLGILRSGKGMAYAAGFPNSEFLKTIDYGLTWEIISNTYEQIGIETLYNLERVGDGILAIGIGEDGDEYGHFIHSNDDGITWVDYGILIGVPDDELYGLQSIGGNRVLVSHTSFDEPWENFIKYSENNGQTWSTATKPSPGYEQVQARHFLSLDAGLILCVSDDVNHPIWASQDYGKTWLSRGNDAISVKQNQDTRITYCAPDLLVMAHYMASTTGIHILQTPKYSLDAYLDSYLASSVHVTTQTYVVLDSANHLIILDNLPGGDLTIICTPTFTGDDADQILNIEFLPG